ncbi:MAG: hypothetical protein KIT33_09260 [Candidatus Kapabacteria bacterium]|nr:hypothetical protein [Ignavibacteriota bacterium]MCW5885144.1 hypothetical protein [Candidatus Kapabacteria bacterium]
MSANMNSARLLFYGAVEDEDKLEQAIKEFEQIIASNPKMEGVATTYIGSLIMLKGKHAFWPHKKVAFVNEGLEVMDKGLKIDPNNIESLFIYGSTCYYLPSFLGKSKLAKEKLRKLVEIIDDDNIVLYDNKIMTNALTFVLEKIEVSDSDKVKINKYLTKLESRK